MRLINARNMEHITYMRFFMASWVWKFVLSGGGAWRVILGLEIYELAKHSVN